VRQKKERQEKVGRQKEGQKKRRRRAEEEALPPSTYHHKHLVYLSIYAYLCLCMYISIYEHDGRRRAGGCIYEYILV
jgi:hypothetical protein